MKKTKLFFAGMIISVMCLVSCGSEETTVEKSATTFEFAKTTEMLNFESSLKLWMQSKREENPNSKQSSEVTLVTEKAAQELLVSIGKSDLAEKTNQSSDELIRIAMKEYSKKLTEIYNNSKTIR